MCHLTSTAGMRRSTIDQNLTHNIWTNLGDCDFNTAMYRSRHHGMPDAERDQCIEDLEYINMHLRAAYKRAKQMYERAMCTDCSQEPDPAIPQEQAQWSRRRRNRDPWTLADH